MAAWLRAPGSQAAARPHRHIHTGPNPCLTYTMPQTHMNDIVEASANVSLSVMRMCQITYMMESVPMHGQCCARLSLCVPQRIPSKYIFPSDESAASRNTNGMLELLFCFGGNSGFDVQRCFWCSIFFSSSFQCYLFCLGHFTSWALGSVFTLSVQFLIVARFLP